MRLVPNDYPITAEVFWPTRACIEEGSVSVRSSPVSSTELVIEWGHEATVQVGEVLILATTWMRTGMRYTRPFSGSIREFHDWCQSENGRNRILDDIVKIQNYFVDHLKNSYPYHRDVSNLRHFGPQEWPYYSFATECGGVASVLNPAARSGVAAAPLRLAFDEEVFEESVPFITRTLFRGFDLVDCGYPTEAVLISFSVLDATIQRCLQRAMVKLAVKEESAMALLRNTTMSRIVTYLDPVLQLVCGHSMAVDDPSLFAKIADVNKRRNSAIHNGKELSRSEAHDALVAIYDVLDYVKTVLAPEIDIPPKPAFS